MTLDSFALLAVLLSEPGYATAAVAGDSLLYVGDHFKHTDLSET